MIRYFYIGIMSRSEYEASTQRLLDRCKGKIQDNWGNRIEAWCAFARYSIMTL